VEVVCNLRKDTCPVDAVDCSEAMGAVDLRVGEQGLDNVLRKLVSFPCTWLGPTYLAVIKSAIYGNVMHVGVQNCGHLSLLNRADLALRVHDKHADIFLASQTVDGGRASVTAGRTNNSQVFPFFASLILALVPANEEVLEEVAQELQSNILESKGRAVEQLQ